MEMEMERREVKAELYKTAIVVYVSAVACSGQQQQPWPKHHLYTCVCERVCVCAHK